MRRLERRPPSAGTRVPRRAARRPEILLALRRRPRLRWALAAVLALGAALTVHGLAAAADAERDRWGTSRTVAVAARDLVAGSAVEPGDIRLEDLPAATAPATAVIDEPVGRVVAAPVYAGEPLDERRLAPTGLSGVAALLPSGTRAVAVPADPATIPAVAVGDHVDVVVAADAFGEPTRPVVAAERATVVHVGEQAITVAVPEHDAPAVAVAATTGLLALALAGA